MEDPFKIEFEDGTTYSWSTFVASCAVGLAGAVLICMGIEATMSWKERREDRKMKESAEKLNTLYV